jgi:hypothetical protein
MSQSTLLHTLSIYVADPVTLREPLPARYFTNNPRTLPADKGGPKYVLGDSGEPMLFSIAGAIHIGTKHSVTPYGTFTGKGQYVGDLLTLRPTVTYTTLGSRYISQGIAEGSPSIRN